MNDLFTLFHPSLYHLNELNKGQYIILPSYIEDELKLLQTKPKKVIEEYQLNPNQYFPEHLYLEEDYDYYGNILLPQGLKIKGDLFYSDDFQNVLQKTQSINDFTDKIKYPRTFHFDFSPGKTDDDKVIKNTDQFIGRRVIVTEKYDGENTTMYTHYIHARSIDSKNHESRDWVKSFHSHIQYDIPEGWRVCGENLFAKHSISYLDLPSYFIGFSVWDDKNVCLGWDDTLEWLSMLDIAPPRVFYDGIFDTDIIKNLWKEGDKTEGFVMRIADSFTYSSFRDNVAKFVRKGHVQTNKHWMNEKIEKNELAIKKKTEMFKTT